jgi:hypothetical protein
MEEGGQLMKLNIFRGLMSVVFVFFALFGGSHPPATGNPIEDLIIRIMSGIWSCDNEPGTALKNTLVGTWHMSLAAVVPPLPDIPFNPIKKSSNWQISDSGARLSIRYDGKDRWYSEPPLVHFEGVPLPSGTPNEAKTSCTFNGSGKAFLKTFIKPAFPPSLLTDLTGNYIDSVSITMQTDDSVTATIIVTLNGQYTEDGKVNKLYAKETITYTGVRR